MNKRGEVPRKGVAWTATQKMGIFKRKIIMRNVYLLRCDESEWNADGNRYCVRTDIPLTEKGIAQAEFVQKK